MTRQLREDGIVVYAIHIAETPKCPTRSSTSPVPRAVVSFSRATRQRCRQSFNVLTRCSKRSWRKVGAESMDAFGPFCIAVLVLIALWTLLSYFLRYTPW